MGESEQKSQLENNQEIGFQSDPPIDTDNLVKFLTEKLQNLEISRQNEGFGRDLTERSVVRVMDEEDEVKRVIGKELQELVVKEAVNEAIRDESSREVAGNIKGFPKECRVLEEIEAAENGLGHDKDSKKVDDNDVKVLERKEDDLKEKHEILIENEHGGSEIGGYEYNSEERSEDGRDREFENGDELQNEFGEGGSATVPADGQLKGYHYPVRPDAEDCSYYMRTGMCKFGSNCKFNHPLKRRNQQPLKETMKLKEENSERPGQIDCKYYLSAAGCKYGKVCKFNHGRGKTIATPVVEYNFLGLPIRPGEKECPYYMRNGSCKYGPNCRFNHPDPTAIGGDGPATYGNGAPGPLHGAPGPLQGAPQPTMPSWSVPRTPNRPATFVPMMYSPPQNMLPPNPDWNSYPAPAPAPVYPTSERNLPIPPAFFLNNPPSDTNLYTQHQLQMLVSDYPERPGQPECSYFMKTRDCKYKSGCKFHHPKSRITRTAPSVLSDKGLPLRPDQNICTHYSRYGICKYGPACKYDHPVNYSNSNPTGGGGYPPDGSDGPLIQQSM